MASRESRLMRYLYLELVDNTDALDRHIAGRPGAAPNLLPTSAAAPCTPASLACSASSPTRYPR